MDEVEPPTQGAEERGRGPAGEVLLPAALAIQPGLEKGFGGGRSRAVRRAQCLPPVVLSVLSGGRAWCRGRTPGPRGVPSSSGRRGGTRGPPGRVARAGVRTGSRDMSPCRACSVAVARQTRCGSTALGPKGIP